MGLNYAQATFRYEPYPIGVATSVFKPDAYLALCQAYPDESRFKALTSGGYHKWSLSERNNRVAYHEFIMQSPVWGAFHTYVKSRRVVDDLAACLIGAGIEAPHGPLTARFEFSSLPAEGGGIEAHTDIPSKVLTLILPMVQPGEWDPSWGGGTDVLRPLDPWRRYEDYQEPRKAFEVVATYPYAPNQCVIFIKTFNSWHAVGPIQGPAGQWRRTITLNLERPS
jgi:hypothetical protein